MKHLSEVNMTYLGHLALAIRNAFRLAFAAIVLSIHGFFPNFFDKTASTIIRNILKSIPVSVSGDRILVRFNTKWLEDELGRQWRVLVNGKETLAHSVNINTFCETIEEEVDGVQKFHFLSYGKVYWDGDNAEIEAK
jgi:hypothetical protein